MSSLLYDFVFEKCVDRVHIKVDEEDDCGFRADYLKARQDLEASLNDEEKKLLKRYANCLELQLGYIYYQSGIELLNTGIKIGMELQEAFEEFKG